MKRLGPWGVACVAMLSAAGLAWPGDWPQFRGPHGNGVSAATDGVPTEWGPDRNLVWKVKLPGPGASSPIVLGDRLFVTCYSGYGLVKKQGEVKELRRHVLCFDRRTGAQLWERVIEPRLPEMDYGGQVVQHGYATSTPATDGERLYVFFGRTGVLAFDLDGKLLWHVEVGKALNSWGSGASPIVYHGRVLVNAGVESDRLVALDAKTGKEVWSVKGIGDSWATPLLVDIPNGKTELVLSTAEALVGLDPDTGERLWRCADLTTNTAAATPVARAGIVYFTGATPTAKRSMFAVRAGGRGDVTKTHVLWLQKAGGNLASPLLLGEQVWFIAGNVWCVRADTGKVVATQRLYDANQEYASPVAVGDRIILFTRRHGAYVLRGGPTIETLAHNDLGDPSEFNGTPAVSDGRLYIRSNTHLYALGRK